MEKNIFKMAQEVSRNTGFNYVDDDAAVVGDLVISTDQFIENTHFRWNYFHPRDVGYKAVVQALSDLAAMATLPSGILVSLACPTSQLEKVPDVFLGIEMACKEYGVPLVGGDTSSTTDVFYLDIVVFGKSQKPLLKTGAQHGDLLVVSGTIGSAHGGFLSYENDWDYPNLKNSFLKPKAHIELAQKVLSLGATSLTDISDSLSTSIYSLSEHSHCGFEVEREKIPFHNELQSLTTKHQLDLTKILLGGGEDYQLLMTLPQNISVKLLSDLGLTVIGHATKELSCTYTVAEKKEVLPLESWDPFTL